MMTLVATRMPRSFHLINPDAAPLLRRRKRKDGEVV
jgi:hypothetical protein